MKRAAVELNKNELQHVVLGLQSHSNHAWSRGSEALAVRLRARANELWAIQEQLEDEIIEP